MQALCRQREIFQFPVILRKSGLGCETIRLRVSVWANYMCVDNAKMLLHLRSYMIIIIVVTDT